MAVRAERSFFFGVLSTALDGRFVDFDLEGYMGYSPKYAFVQNAIAIGAPPRRSSGGPPAEVFVESSPAPAPLDRLLAN